MEGSYSKIAAALAKKKKKNKAGIPEGQKDPGYYGADASQDGNVPRALLEQQNNQLAQKLLKEQQDKIKKGM